MKKFALWIFVFLSIQSFNNGIAQTGGRERLLMDAHWKFSQTDTLGAEKAGFDDRRWRMLNLPHDWSIESEFIQTAPTGGGAGYLPTGIGWYRKDFNLSKSAMSESVWIEFDGVYQNSDVWINGHHLGHYPNGYMSFYYDLTSYVKPGKNVITVKVDNSLQPNTRWYSGSGIYRHVWLNIANRLHVAQWGTYITTPQADSLSASVNIKTQINNLRTIPESAVLRSVIVDDKGRAVGRTELPVSVSSKAQAEIEQIITVKNPALWSLELPTLYKVHSTVLDQGKIIDEVVSSFGIRNIRYDADEGFLNERQKNKNEGCVFTP